MATWNQRAVRTGALLALVAVAGLLAVSSEPFRRSLIERFSPEYAAPAVSPPRGAKLDLEPVASGLGFVTDVQPIPERPGSFAVVEKRGTVRLLTLADGEVATPGPVLFSAEVETASEMGMLGVAFHPSYADNGRVFVNLNPAGASHTRVVELRLPLKTLGTERAVVVRTVLEVEQPYQNHNGGALLFGPDGMLYVGLGDGGWMGDPRGSGQDPSTLLGAVLRLDVARSADDAPYTVPPDNPFVGREGFRPELFAYGLRNPWKMSFAGPGRLLVGDVGQDLLEEIDLVESGGNLGWNAREGDRCFEPEQGCRTEGLVEPIFVYGRDDGASVTGGYVVTSERIPALTQRYIFADFVSGSIWALQVPDTPAPVEATHLGSWPLLISTFARDHDGDVLVGDFGGGKLYRFVMK